MSCILIFQLAEIMAMHNSSLNQDLHQRACRFAAHGVVPLARRYAYREIDE